LRGVVAALVATGCGPMAGAVDVRSYPPAQRANYAIVEDRCSRCHGLDRATTHAVDQGEWAGYVSDMAREPGAGISAQDQHQIVSFLEFHSARQRATRRTAQ
jgi:hypothetical protein